MNNPLLTLFKEQLENDSIKITRVAPYKHRIEKANREQTIFNSKPRGVTQTTRVLGHAHKEGTLKENVVVSVCVITSQGNKEFGNNVAVNLNNQARLGSSFLRSTGL